MMKNIRAYIITMSRVKKANLLYESCIYSYFYLFRLLSSQWEIVSLFPPLFSPNHFYSLLYFLFLHFSRKVTPGKVGGARSFELESRSCNCILRLWALSARTYGKSLQLALITLEWSTINSRNLQPSISVTVTGFCEIEQRRSCISLDWWRSAKNISDNLTPSESFN